MIEIVRTLTTICRQLEKTDGHDCSVANTFFEGWLSELSATNLGRGEDKYSDVDYYFNRRFEEERRSGYDFPVMVLSPLDKVADKNLFRLTNTAVSIDVEVWCFDKHKNDLYGVNDYCSSRTAEQIGEDCERILIKVWSEFFKRSKERVLSKFYVVSGNVRVDVIKNEVIGNDKVSGRKMMFALSFKTCETGGTFDETKTKPASLIMAKN